MAVICTALRRIEKRGLEIRELKAQKDLFDDERTQKLLFEETLELNRQAEGLRRLQSVVKTFSMKG